MLRDLEHNAMRQQDIAYQHAVCDAYPELEHLRPARPAVITKPAYEEVTVDYYPEFTSMKEAAAFVAREHGISVKELLGRERSKKLSRARADLVMICRVKLKTPLEVVGRMMDGRDYVTVLHYWGLAVDAGKVAA